MQSTLTFDQKRKEIFKMMTHYFFYKRLFSNELLESFLSYLKDAQNPFIHLKSEMEAELEAKGSNYALSSDVFYYELEGDEPKKPTPPKNDTSIQVMNLSNQNLVYCNVCKEALWYIYNNPSDMTFFCKKCSNIFKVGKTEKQEAKE
jgi:hypothetical protein